MKNPLPPQFSKGPWTWTTMRQNGPVRILRKTHRNLGDAGFEVVITHTQKETTLKGVLIPEKEAMPSSSEWGTYGWSYTEQSHRDPLRSARERFDSILEGLKSSEGIS